MPFIPLSSFCFSVFTPFQKKKMSTCTHFRVQFPLHWLAYLYSTLQFPLQSDTCIQKQFLLQNLCTCIPLHSSLTVIQYLYSCFIIYHYSHSLSTCRKKIQNSKKTLQNSSANRVCWWRSKGIDHKIKVITNKNIKDLWDVSQLCTKQVGTGEMIK